MIYEYFHIFFDHFRAFPLIFIAWRVLGVPGGSFRCPWKCSGALGASLWVRVTSLGVPGGSFGGPWGSWSCSCEALGGHLGTFGGILGVLGRSWGGSLGEPVGDQVLQTLRTPMFQRLPCFPCFSTNFLVFLLLCSFFCVLVLALGVPELSWEALRVPRACLRVFEVPWDVLGSSWGVLGDSLKVHAGQIDYIYEGFE